ncbi:hypothetical protein X777_12587 [Ooceraea biroi]|uniref:Uncharacterized protein n=1 Tax=Ooceraea biroi TaxID=2015173 RepID=A0A026VZH3_OOCBI|nr:hypothetical protein X777_12587 [Ooceraea biroi]
MLIPRLNRAFAVIRRSFPTEKRLQAKRVVRQYCDKTRGEGRRRGRTGIEECVIVLKETELRCALPPPPSSSSSSFVWDV